MLGISGIIAKRFLASEITPLLALVGFLLGVFAVLITPREEEPQIDVTFANVFIAFPGASAKEVEHLVTASTEQVLSEIEGVKHIYSVSQPGRAILTVEYKVGEDRTRAIVRLYNAIYSNQDWLPPNSGVAQPLIKPKGIDDVPIVAVTLWTEDPKRGAYELQLVAHAVEAELKRVPGTRDIDTLGGPGRIVQVQLDPARLAGYGLSLDDLRNALLAGNVSREAGSVVSDNQEIPVQAGQFFSSVTDLKELVVGMHGQEPVLLNQVADIRLGPEQPKQRVWFGTGPGAAQKDITARGEFPAVTIAVAKKPGTNAVEIADQVIERFEQLRGTLLPAGVHATVTRNYGATANDKAQTLIKKLIFATLSVVVLVLIALGWREAVIVGTAVVVTLAITLFASWAWGFTLNRVSLFALIFSIGILVDDAIVVVENIHRHWRRGGGSLVEIIPAAVDEVGGPTILATFTVIAALLPMAFVTGLMGPYMKPIPINASIGMLISLAVAFVVTPWLARRMLASHTEQSSEDDKLYRFFQRAIGPFLEKEHGRTRRRLLGLAIGILIVLSLSLGVFQLVVLKMLPFDNKSEFDVVVDMPEGTTLEQTARVLGEMGRYLATVPEVTDYQAYAGTASPINFNGLVRQYYLRSGPNIGDIQVNLADKHQRTRKSHAIAQTVRKPLQAIAAKYQAIVKIAEVPPGPPVLAPIVAEIYGPDYAGQIQVAKRVREVFANTKDIVDIDDSVEYPAPKWIVAVDQHKAAQLGIAQRDVVNAITALLQGDDVSYLHDEYAKYPVPIRLQASIADQASLDALLSLRVRSQGGALVPISEIAKIQETTREPSIYHKDLLPVVFVVGDMAGRLDSPLYGLFEIYEKLRADPPVREGSFPQAFIRQPANPYEFSMKWDGEWQITYETFRDMGIAYAVGLLLIYLLVVAQFKSYVVPLIIMAPIPLTIIGVLPGHALLGAPFTATSMIGMIALAGIIVRNSILLVDFVNEAIRDGKSLEEALIRAGAVRAKPIILTGLAAMLGAFFIIDDPIFSGLAISLIFGIFVSTLLTLMVIPVLYFVARTTGSRSTHRPL